MNQQIKHRQSQFFNFIIQRQKIWYDRVILKKPYPWTDDIILQKYKFCNIYRELDKGTMHLIQCIINESLADDIKVFNIILYRRFNVYNFFNDIIGVQLPEFFDFPLLEKVFDEKKANGRKLFNEAYILCQRTFESSYRKGDKHVQVLLAMQRIADNIPGIMKQIKDSESLEEVHRVIMQEPLIGNFLAHQILVDMTYIPGFLRYDVNSFVDIGPGALKGIELIYGDNDSPLKRCKELFAMQHLYLRENWIKIFFRDAHYRNLYLSLSNIQHSLCEFRKYIMLQQNPKARKRYFRPPKPRR